MLQIDHVYEFLYQELFKDFKFWHLFGGVPKLSPVEFNDISVFTPDLMSPRKIFFYDQEPVIPAVAEPYLDVFDCHSLGPVSTVGTLVTSEYSSIVDQLVSERDYKKLYYFFHGFAAVDWYRGYFALNYNKSVIKTYKHDFISYNRIINNDRSYRIYFVSKLIEQKLLPKGLVSFGVTDDINSDWRDETSDPHSKLSELAKQHIEKHMNVTKLVIDSSSVSGTASANIPRNISSFDPENNLINVDSLWHVVTETVFYYDKLHLTEKIFKPIVSKQPFMLLAAPGNLAYLKSYGFKTFDGIIDESYDSIQDNDQRVDAVVAQLQWYCSLSQEEKNSVIERLAPIVEYNFYHFYGEFRHIITRELLDNSKTLFKEIGYDDTTIAYENIYQVLTN
jgi:hypothetical protein